MHRVDLRSTHETTTTTTPVRRRVVALPDSTQQRDDVLAGAGAPAFLLSAIRADSEGSTDGSKQIDVAVLGATGSVGQRYVELLAATLSFDSPKSSAPSAAPENATPRCDRLAHLNAAPPDDVANMVDQAPRGADQSPIVFCSLPAASR